VVPPERVGQRDEMAVVGASGTCEAPTKPFTSKLTL
jgi:hypothetical protein